MDSSVDRGRSALKSSTRCSISRLVLLIPLLFLALFFFYPLCAILLRSLAAQGALDMSAFTEIVTSEYYLGTLGFTVQQAVISTALTIGLALPGAYVFARYRFPAKGLFMAFSTLPFVLPTVVVAAAFSALVGSRGVLNVWLMDTFALRQPPIQLLDTYAIILIAHVFYNYALALRMISSYWANLNPRMEEAARVLGAHGWRLWWDVRLPLLRPAITAAALLVFIFTFTSFGVVLILGGPRFATLEVEIQRQALDLFNLPVAAALSLVQIGIMFVTLLLYTLLQRRITGDVQSAALATKTPSSWRERVLVLGNLLVMVVLLFTPLLALVWRSLTLGADGITLEHYTALTENTRRSILYVAPLEAVGNSLAFAIVTTLLALLLGVLASYLLAGRSVWRARWLDPIFMLPLATSAVTLGLGYILSMDFDGARLLINQLPFVEIGGDWDLRASWLLVPLSHTLVALPFVVRSVLPAIQRISPIISESAAVLGAPPARRWRLIDLPLIGRGLVVGATFAFTVSMGEFGASLFVARPESATMPIAIFRLLSQPRLENYGQALALSVLLMAVCAISFLVIEHVRTAGIGEF